MGSTRAPGSSAERFPRLREAGSELPGLSSASGVSSLVVSDSSCVYGWIPSSFTGGSIAAKVVWVFFFLEEQLLVFPFEK